HTRSFGRGLAHCHIEKIFLVLIYHRVFVQRHAFAFGLRDTLNGKRTGKSAAAATMTVVLIFKILPDTISKFFVARKRKSFPGCLVHILNPPPISDYAFRAGDLDLRNLILRGQGHFLGDASDTLHEVPVLTCIYSCYPVSFGLSFLFAHNSLMNDVNSSSFLDSLLQNVASLFLLWSKVLIGLDDLIGLCRIVLSFRAGTENVLDFLALGTNRSFSSSTRWNFRRFRCTYRLDFRLALRGGNGPDFGLAFRQFNRGIILGPFRVRINVVPNPLFPVSQRLANFDFFQCRSDGRSRLRKVFSKARGASLVRRADCDR